MSVLRMSAQQSRFSTVSGTKRKEESPKNTRYWRVLSSPKAEVRGSNPFGRANDFKGLRQTLHRCGELLLQIPSAQGKMLPGHLLDLRAPLVPRPLLRTVSKTPDVTPRRRDRRHEDRKAGLATMR
jgi:hypothetical protein